VIETKPGDLSPHDNMGWPVCCFREPVCDPVRDLLNLLGKVSKHLPTISPVVSHRSTYPAVAAARTLTSIWGEAAPVPAEM
jgi:hypothetical protein